MKKNGVHEGFGDDSTCEQREKFCDPQTPSAEAFFGQPEDCHALINQYGTYNIQPTADSDNPYPAIAQGTPKKQPSPEPDKPRKKFQKKRSIPIDK